MLKLNYKLNGVPMSVSFESNRDMILFVAANKIKDEDLISVDLGEGLIDGGIEGLANHYVEKITREKEEEQRLAEEEAAREAEELAKNTYNMVDLFEHDIEDRFLSVDSVDVDEDMVRVEFDNGESLVVDPEDRFYIIRNGEEYIDAYDYATHATEEFNELEDLPVIRVRAKYIHEGDIVVNK